MNVIITLANIKSMIIIVIKESSPQKIIIIRAVFDEEYWVGYRKVNEKFAEETLKALRGMDKVPFYHDVVVRLMVMMMMMMMTMVMTMIMMMMFCINL